MCGRLRSVYCMGTNEIWKGTIGLTSFFSIFEIHLKSRRWSFVEETERSVLCPSMFVPRTTSVLPTRRSMFWKMKVTTPRFVETIREWGLICSTKSVLYPWQPFTTFMDHDQLCDRGIAFASPFDGTQRNKCSLETRSVLRGTKRTLILTSSYY